MGCRDEWPARLRQDAVGAARFGCVDETRGVWGTSDLMGVKCARRVVCHCCSCHHPLLQLLLLTFYSDVPHGACAEYDRKWYGRELC